MPTRIRAQLMKGTARVRVVQGRRGSVRLYEEGEKEYEMPAHHNLDRYLEEYLEAAGSEI